MTTDGAIPTFLDEEQRALRGAYLRQRNSAKPRGIEWRFTFDTWLAVWRASRHLESRGRGRGKYVMARFGDVGPYAPDNVEIIPYQQNARDCRQNHPVSTGELSRRAIGKGRGWHFHKGAFAVSVAKKYIGRYPTQELAEAAYARAVTQRLESLGVHVGSSSGNGHG